MFADNSRAIFAIAGQLILPAAIVAFALWRGARARAAGAQDRIHAWTKRAYWCFLVWGVFLVVSVPVLLRIEHLPSDQQEGGAAAFGLAVGVPVCIVFLVGVFHAVMVWRGRWIRVLLLPTVVAAGFFFLDEARTEPLIHSPWDSVLGVVYALIILVASICGIREMRALDRATQPRTAE